MTWRRRLVLLLTLAMVGSSALSCQSSEPSVEPAEIGMNLHFRGADAATIKRQFDLMAAMNVAWVRVDVDWSVIESERGQFDWTSVDMIVDEAAARGIDVLAVLVFSPAWARSTTTADPATADPATANRSRPVPSEWATFAHVAAQRYAPLGVHSWEIWNEPNTSKFWPPRPDVNEYGSLFWVAADAIRGVDPEATLLIGGLSPKYDVPEAELTPVDYLEALYANGAAQRADGVAAHPYTFPALPMDAQQRTVGGFPDLPALHAVMERHGDGGKKIWITEFGAPTGTGPNAVSEDNQAASLVQAREQVADWDWAGPLMYYELVDGGTDPAEIEQNFGVVREDLSPKAAADALMD
jgi:GH35 family endo-1,4-beta-xylanase